jgi:electron transfer flavoprotein alpha subunit
MSVLVFADLSKGLSKSAAEAVFYGKKIAAQIGGDVHAVCLGSDAQAAAELGTYGAAAAHLFAADASENGVLSKAVAAAAAKTGAKVIIFSHDNTGKAVAPRVSARLNAGYVAGAIDLPDTSAGFVVKVNAFSGKAFAFMQVHTDVKVISLLPNSFKPETSGAPCPTQPLDGDFGASRIVKKELLSEGGALPLPEAELVVSAGRGLKGPENWGIVEELAKELGAATACSRPVADMHWRPHHEHVGQTGVAIRPNLYIAAGISGAIQHLAGVNGSKVIVVINSDPEAPFFKAADYGVVGDAFQVLPRLTEAVRKFKASNH